MKILLDEDVPEPLIEMIRRLLVGHDVQHVRDLSWKGKKDIPLFADAARRGFEAILTNNLRQLSDPDECKAIRRSKMHHVTYELEDGLDGLANASASILSAIRPLVSKLEAAKSQRIVRIRKISKRRDSFVISNPAVDPPSPYW